MRIIGLEIMALALGRTMYRCRVLAFRPTKLLRRHRMGGGSMTTLFSSQTDERTIQDESATATPWNDPRVHDRIKTRRRNNNNRCRQHVNPLSRQYQQPTELSEEWPNDAFDNVNNRDLHVDIGCGKGGFLLEYAASEFAARESYNYLGLEIRPMVARFAKERVGLHQMQGKVDFLGCNANVDLDRLLKRYHDAAATPERPMLLSRVSIQYPDPHFKKQHAKRRVVTPDLIDNIARFMPPSSGMVFLQSDVQVVLDDMRDRFAEVPKYFALAGVHQDNEYLPDNPLGVPTEREVSVLQKDLPVFRVLFQRTETLYEPKEGESSYPPADE